MKSTVRSITAAFALCLGLANASGPIGVYALVDTVALEPNGDKPEHIRIAGVFITATGTAGSYSEPQHGYVYFALPAQNRDLALREWADLRSLAGTRQVVGFGSSWSTNVRVRKADGTANSPDEYPMGNGLVKVNPDQPRAKALLEYKGR